MGVPNLSDGTPLSYEWLNQVADTINKLEIQNSSETRVKFVGQINSQDIQVLTGEQRVEVPAGQTKGAAYKIENIQFPVTFGEKPWVLASIYIKNDNAAFPAGISIANATESNFDATVQLFNDSGNLSNKKFYIRYVAIGKRQATI